jgi:hypothetical protein
MANEALIAAVVAALVDYPLSAYLATRPSTSVWTRMAFVGTVAYIGVKAADYLVQEKGEQI